MSLSPQHGLKHVIFGRANFYNEHARGSIAQRFPCLNDPIQHVHASYPTVLSSQAATCTGSFYYVTYAFFSKRSFHCSLLKLFLVQ